jgi:uncharacterized ferredoxin-like protein
MTDKRTAVSMVASLMALAARTAPKAKGVDTIVVRVLGAEDLRKLAHAMSAYGKDHGKAFFLRDAKNMLASDACVIIGAKGDLTAGIDCGACGWATCAEMTRARKKHRKQTTPFAGPNCAVRMADLGIAVGSAAKTAQIHNVDNRIMYTGGTAAVALGLLGKDCTVAYAIPLSASGKNIFFDRTA